MWFLMFPAGMWCFADVVMIVEIMLYTDVTVVFSMSMVESLFFYFLCECCPVCFFCS